MTLVETMAQDYGARLKSEAKFRSPQKAKPKPVTTITITFERMPIEAGNWTSPVVMRFERVENETHLYLAGKIIGRAHFGSWENAMIGALFDAVGHTYGIHDAFRHWIWLEKAMYECRKYGYIEEHYFSDAIAREFGKVTVEVK